MESQIRAMTSDPDSAVIHEIFSSVQGEGLYIGSWQIFIRFRGCSLTCLHCDTPSSWEISDSPCSVHAALNTNCFTTESNPFNKERLIRVIDDLDQPAQFHSHIVLTGGEPCEQIGFLKQWLPGIREHYRIMLETNAVHHEQIHQIRDYIDFVSMDYKLPSFTGTPAHDEQHLLFYKEMIHVPGQIKIVVTPLTRDEEICDAADTIKQSGTRNPVIIQPSREYRTLYTGTAGQHATDGHDPEPATIPGRVVNQKHDKPLLARLRHFSAILKQHGHDTRIIPQMHPDWRIP